MSLSAEFRRSIKPLVIINSIFTTGLVEYFDDDKIKAIGMVYASFSIIFYITLVNVIPFPAEKFKVKLSLLIQILHEVHVHSSHVFLIVNIVVGVLRRKKVKRFTFQIDTCIRKMGQLDIPTNLSKYFLLQCYIISVLVFVLIAMIMIDHRWLVTSETSYWKLFVFFYVERYPIFVWLITDVTFVFWIWYIKTKFSQLNVLLKNMLTTTIDSPQHKRILRMCNKRKNDSPTFDIHRTNKSNEDVVKIKKAREIHLELIKCARNTNYAYGIHCLMSVPTAFNFIIILGYNVYYFLETIDHHLQPLQLFIHLFWICYFGFKIVIVCLVCVETVKEVCSFNIFIVLLFCYKYFLSCFNEIFIVISINVMSYFFLHATNTGDILCELYEPSTSKEFRAEIRDFILQLVQNPLTFTSCGFFDLDHKLIRSVIGTVVTYLVILIQFGKVSA